MKAAFLYVCIFFLVSCTGSPGISKASLLNLDGKSQVSAGTVDMETDAFGRKEDTPVSLFFYPAEGILAMNFLYEYVTFRQFWDENALAVLAGSLACFLADYEQGNLKPGRARRAYGRVSLVVEWRSFDFSGLFRSCPYLDLGYSFRNGELYFLLLQREAEELNFSSHRLRSRRIAAFFSLSQARALSARLATLQGDRE